MQDPELEWLDNYNKYIMCVLIKILKRGFGILAPVLSAYGDFSHSFCFMRF
jgi:hypothetical protein